MSANFESLVSSSGSLTVKYSTKDLWNGEYPCMTSLIPRWLKPIIRELMLWNPDFEQIGCTRLFMFLELFALLNVTSILELIGVKPHHRDNIATNIEAGIEFSIGKKYGLGQPRNYDFDLLLVMAAIVPVLKSCEFTTINLVAGFCTCAEEL